MRFVNATSKTVYTAISGHLFPGETSADGGPRRRRLQEALEEVVSACKTGLGVKLNVKESALLSRLMDLDEKGFSFKKDSLPNDVLEDPDGEKGIDQSAADAQRQHISEIQENNGKAAAREAVINGEVDDRAENAERKPVGPATMKGEEVDASKLGNGLERIMAENARIQAGKAQVGTDEILDPIGVHAKESRLGDSGADVGEAEAGTDEAEAEAEADAVGKDPKPVVHASGRDDDGTRSADAEPPTPVAPEKGGRMDKVAADIAAKLSTIGPADTPDKSARKQPKAKTPAKGKRAQ